MKSLANGAVYGVGLNEEEGLLEFESISSIESAEEDFLVHGLISILILFLCEWGDIWRRTGIRRGSPCNRALSTIEPVLIVEKSENEIEQDNFEFSTANGAIFGESLSILEEEFQSGISPFMLQVEEPVSEIEKKGAQVTTPSGSQEITDEGPTLATPNYDGATGTKPGAQVLLPDKDKKEKPESEKISEVEPVVTVIPEVTPTTVPVQETEEDKEKKGAQVTTPSGSQEITDEGATLATPNYDGHNWNQARCSVLLPDKTRKRNQNLKRPPVSSQL